MVHDYVAALRQAQDPDPPMKFAKEYYIHYPKVAMGHWPPFFYVVQTAWTLLFSPSRISMILLMAFLTTLLSGSICLAVRKMYGHYMAAGTGLLLMTLPLIQRYSGMVMAEILVALLCFCAALCFGAFLDTESPRWNLGFSFFATLAILTKGNGLALALVPPLAVIFTRRFHLFTCPKFWGPGIIVPVICAPWYWLTLDMAKNGMMSESFSPDFILTAFPYFSFQAVKIGGIGLSLLMAAGFVSQVILPALKRGAEGKWAVCGALFLSVLIFQSVTPAGLEARHLITAVPALLMFLAAGISSLARRLPGEFAQERKTAILMLAATCVFAYETFEMPGKEWSGFGKAAQWVLSEKDIQPVVMISSDERGEGIFVSEIAMREQCPEHFVLRASKVLARSRWSGSNYELKCKTPGEVMNICLRKIPMKIIVIDESVPSGSHLAHNDLLKETIEKYSHLFELSGVYSLTRRGTLYADAIKIYRLAGRDTPQANKICVDLFNMLKEEICLDF